MEAYNLKLHESCKVDDMVYKRIVGGWLVHYHQSPCSTAVFVPYSREFAPKSKEQQYDEMFQSFIDWFNATTGRNFKYTDNYRKMFNARVKEGFTMDDFKKATKAMLKNKWVVDNKKQEPVHLLRPDNFQRYLNQPEVDKAKQPISYTGGW